MNISSEIQCVKDDYKSKFISSSSNVIAFKSEVVEVMRAIFQDYNKSESGELSYHEMYRLMKATEGEKLTREQFNAVRLSVERKPGSKGISFKGFLQLYLDVYDDEGLRGGDANVLKDIKRLGFIASPLPKNTKVTKTSKLKESKAKLKNQKLKSSTILQLKDVSKKAVVKKTKKKKDIASKGDMNALNIKKSNKNKKSNPLMKAFFSKPKTVISTTNTKESDLREKIKSAESIAPIFLSKKSKAEKLEEKKRENKIILLQESQEVKDLDKKFYHGKKINPFFAAQKEISDAYKSLKDDKLQSDKSDGIILELKKKWKLLRFPRSCHVIQHNDFNHSLDDSTLGSSSYTGNSAMELDTEFKMYFKEIFGLIKIQTAQERLFYHNNPVYSSASNKSVSIIDICDNNDSITASTTNSSCSSTKSRHISSEESYLEQLELKGVSSLPSQSMESFHSYAKYVWGSFSQPSSDSMLWSDKYNPPSSSNICGNHTAVRALTDWLASFKERKGYNNINNNNNNNSSKSFSKYKNDKYIYSSSDYDSDEEDGDDYNTICLIGSLGIGKTTMVYTVANELGFTVKELNASHDRTGKSIQIMLGEATQSHQLDFNSTKKDKGQFTSKTKSKNDKKITAKQRANESGKIPLILVENADNILDTDKGFVAGLKQLSKITKCPIILICQRETDIYESLKSESIYMMSPEYLFPYTKQHIHMISVVEELDAISLSDIDMLLRVFRSDLRQILMWLQYYNLNNNKNNNSNNNSNNMNTIESTKSLVHSPLSVYSFYLLHGVCNWNTLPFSNEHTLNSIRRSSTAVPLDDNNNNNNNNQGNKYNYHSECITVTQLEHELELYTSFRNYIDALKSNPQHKEVIKFGQIKIPLIKKPEIHSIYPHSGPTCGGTLLEIHGTGFKNSAKSIDSDVQVLIGNIFVSKAVVISDSLIMCITPTYSKKVYFEESPYVSMVVRVSGGQCVHRYASSALPDKKDRVVMFRYNGNTIPESINYDNNSNKRGMKRPLLEVMGDIRSSALSTKISNSATTTTTVDGGSIMEVKDDHHSDSCDVDFEDDQIVKYKNRKKKKMRIEESDDDEDDIVMEDDYTTTTTNNNNASVADDVSYKWVQCEDITCGKWRRLPKEISPESLPDIWTCSMCTWVSGGLTCCMTLSTDDCSDNSNNNNNNDENKDGDVLTSTLISDKVLSDILTLAQDQLSKQLCNINMKNNDGDSNTNSNHCNNMKSISNKLSLEERHQIKNELEVLNSLVSASNYLSDSDCVVSPYHRAQCNPGDIHMYQHGIRSSDISALISSMVQYQCYSSSHSYEEDVVNATPANGGTCASTTASLHSNDLAMIPLNRVRDRNYDNCSYVLSKILSPSRVFGDCNSSVSFADYMYGAANVIHWSEVMKREKLLTQRHRNRPVAGYMEMRVGVDLEKSDVDDILTCLSALNY